MKTRLLPLLLALAAPSLSCFAAAATPVPDGPDPREIPVPKIKTPLGTMPGVNELPVLKGMPDIMTMNNGKKVRTLAQWKTRREEIKTILQYYATGVMPPAPGNVKGKELKSELVLAGTVKYRLVHLTFGPEEKVSLDIGIFTPVRGGPFPAIISQQGAPPLATPIPRLPNGPGQGRGLNVLLVVGPNEHPDWIAAAANAPARGGRGGGGGAAPAAGRGGRGGGGGDAAASNAPVLSAAETLARTRSELFRRGYALVVYNNNDCANDTTLREMDGSFSFRKTGFMPHYPGYDWSVLGAWAWGASRVADYLETDSSIDSKHLIITGASRGGKSSMIAAAYDQRLMGAPVVTGGFGVGALRYAGPRNSETFDVMVKKYPNWFSPNAREFWLQKEKLPFDEHWFLALCAPTPFISLEGMTDTISYPTAVKATMEAARPAYALFGKPDAIGANYGNHGHAFTEEDWTAIMDFSDKHYRGNTRRFDVYPTEAELDAALKATQAN